ncbi:MULTISPECIES: NADPH dehydrogenase NamA [Aeribacillus]|jgi:NADPH2 dehydrogenase|uniref:NADPH dehydrogenase NamA n=1 Tax=Aeribacillus TaxID=1055323 RepID=UPI000E36289E|nr:MULTISPECIES: NADPH dehydrogenase NamA [Aeribacillus]REJ25440.1 MAG: NADPH dehydrogenase NamA [Bacillaceae bacterium]MDR9794042.1 NADPH dehydrogenase NamA [Aeribacillus pallidus]MDR9795668.1 NADPH dehydrogenase NamA [Aeribacillus pallidus]MED0704200.1 NADPH dehydrogenase NamA [Aeribacillus composti]RZI51119.1 NADPH dehydrogenase NamA [Aeribacillus pallidus]
MKDRLLFSPFTIKDVTLKNRIVMSPMCMYSAANKKGFLEDFHFTHYISRAVGQVGLIILEATAVTPEGRISELDLGIWEDDHIIKLAELVQQIKSYGAKTGIQLAHAGRKSNVSGDIFAPSSIPFDQNSRTPKELTKEQIKETVEKFQLGAKRAKDAGFDIIEIHAAHGYLINEFLSPLSNKRNDEYGGSLENRYRFLKEVIQAVRKVWEGPLFVRVSASDYVEGGSTINDYVQIAKWLKEDGVDLIDVSSGGLVPANIDVYPGYQVPFSEKIRQEANIKTGAVGLITSPLQAEEILKNNRADLIFVARELLRNPYWPYHAANELNAKIESPTQYERGWRV